MVMDNATASKGKVQAILRMDAGTYDAIRRAARRRYKSFNQFAVETLIREADLEPEGKIKLSELKLDPEWDRFIIHSLDLTEEEIKEDPRLCAILGI